MVSVKNGMKYAFHIIFHPFDGFWDMRHEKRGNVISAIIFMLLFVESTLVMEQYGGFLMFDFNPRTYNVVRQLIALIVPIFLWCVANWCFTALTDGEGRFVDIVMATGYALVPVTITNIVGTILSGVIVQNEIDFVSMILGLGMMWSAILMFCGIATIHQFSATKTVFTIIITLCGMVFIVFLALLFGSIIDDMINFVTGIITEIQLRI